MQEGQSFTSSAMHEADLRRCVRLQVSQTYLILV